MRSEVLLDESNYGFGWQKFPHHNKVTRILGVACNCNACIKGSSQARALYIKVTLMNYSSKK